MSAIDQCETRGKENIDEISQNDGVPKGIEPPCSSEDSNRDSLISDEFEKLEFDQIPQVTAFDANESIPEYNPDTVTASKEDFTETNISDSNYDSHLQNEANLLDDPTEETADHITEGSYQLHGIEERSHRDSPDQHVILEPIESKANVDNSSSDSDEESQNSSDDNAVISNKENLPELVTYETQSVASKVIIREEIITTKESVKCESIQIVTESSNVTSSLMDMTPPNEDLKMFDNSLQKITTEIVDSDLFSSPKKDSCQTGGPHDENLIAEIDEEILKPIPTHLPLLSADILPTLESSPIEIILPQMESPVSLIESKEIFEGLSETQMKISSKEELSSSDASPILVIGEPLIEKASSALTFSQIPTEFDSCAEIGKQFKADDLGLTKNRSITRDDRRQHVLKWSSFSPRIWFKPDQLHPTVMNLVYWRDVKKSGAVFGIVMVILISLLYASFISVMAYSSLALLAGTISFTLYKNVMNAVQKSQDGHPFKEFLDIDTNLSSEKAHELTDLTISQLNSYVSLVKRLFLVEDLLDSVRFGCLLWCLTCVGSWFNGLTLVILSVVALFTLPKVYEQNQTLVDQYIELVSGQVNKVMGKVRAAIPIGGGNKEKDKDKEQ